MEPFHRLRGRGIRQEAEREARRLLARGVADRAELGRLVELHVGRYLPASDDPDEMRARRISLGHGVAAAMGIDVGDDPAEALDAPAWSVEAIPEGEVA